MTLRELVEQTVTLRQQGRELVGLCPLHGEKTPSFSVNEDKGLWYCHGCGTGGDIVSYYVKVRGLSMREALQRTGRASTSYDLQQEHRKRLARDKVLLGFYEWKHAQRRQLDTIGEQIYFAEIAYRSICRAPHIWTEEEQTYWITRLGNLYQTYDRVVWETDVIVNDPQTAWQWWREAQDE